MRIYVGNLSYSLGSDAIERLFQEYGQVEEVYVPTDRETGRPRGFAFVTMPNSNEAQAAIGALNGTEVEGRTITVNEARQRRDGGGGGRSRRW